jgi:hypothetical protein
MHRILALLLLLPTPALAHSWYAAECCNNEDCRPIDDLPETPNGYVYNGQVVPKSKEKQSKDFQFHICIRNGQILCLYVPGRGM